MKKAGFTLVELMISMTILALLLGSFYYVLGAELKIWERIIGRSEEAQIASAVALRIIDDARSAQEILPASSSATLSLKIGNETIEYQLTGNKVRRKKGGYSAYLTDDGEITELTFSYPAGKIVRIKVDDLAASVFLRN
ncbi:MAG: type II secretion system protein [Candidatus Margulisbacteria bacterium]|nr:type II secretion system protein [Candidatus Margulisiibacteriota bacterium]